MYAWGYLPKESWTRVADALEFGSTTEGRVAVNNVDKDIQRGSGYGTPLEHSQATYFEGSGHLLIGKLEEADTLTEIATDTIVGLKDGQLACVILKPEMH